MSVHLIKYLVCYDICDPKRLRRVHHAVRDWGIPVQYSIFEIELHKSQLKKLVAELYDLIEEQEDKVIFYRLSPCQECICLGLAKVTTDVLFV